VHAHLFAEAALPLNDLQKTLVQHHAHLAGVPLPQEITLQGDVSAWMQARYAVHAEATRAWLSSKSNPTTQLVCQPKSLDSLDSGWDVSTAAGEIDLRCSDTDTPTDTLMDTPTHTDRHADRHTDTHADRHADRESYAV